MSLIPEGSMLMEYSKPTVVDFGDLEELTASCVKSTGGDFGFANDPDLGVSNQFGCSSPPP